MKGYGQFCPVAKASEILAERWTPLVLRELMAGSHRFNDLRRGVPLMSRSLLAKRLRALEDAGVVERRTAPGRRGAHAYHLTPAGEELAPIVEGLGAWGQRWVVHDVADEDLDPLLLLWDVRRNLRRDGLPPERRVVRLELEDVTGTGRRWWLLLGPDEVDLCVTDPGFELDATVATTLRPLTRWWLGQEDWRALLARGAVRVEGPRWVARRLPAWLGRSPFADVPRP